MSSNYMGSINALELDLHGLGIPTATGYSGLRWCGHRVSGCKVSPLTMTEMVMQAKLQR